MSSRHSMSTTTQSTTTRERFSVLDWIGLLLTLPGVLVLLAAPVTVTPPFREMFSQFGSEELLPAITRLVMAPWCPPVMALGPLVLAGLSASSRFPIGKRRVFGVAAFFLVLAGAAVYLAGLYWPMYVLARSISSS